MGHKVFCRKYQKELEGMDFPPYPGEKGQKIYNSVSKQAWQEWLKHQTMLINEKKLNLLEPQTRAYLEDELEKYLSGKEHDQAEGYVPPENE